MIDREQVIKAVEHCHIPGNDGCTGCPYDGKALCEAQLGHALIGLLNRQAEIVRCSACKYWDKESGLTARKCERLGIVSTQSDFCSFGRKVGQGGK